MRVVTVRWEDELVGMMGYRRKEIGQRSTETREEKEVGKQKEKLFLKVILILILGFITVGAPQIICT